MTGPAVTTTDTTQTAADAAVAASATVTDPNAQAWTPPANKEAFDKLITDAVTAEASKYKAPEKYDLKLPDKSPVDPAVVERTAAIARELGLSQDNAAKALGFVASEVAAQTAAALSAYAPPSEENKEGGAKWKEQDSAWKAAALADKDLGNGKPEQLTAKVDLAKKVLAKFGDPESIEYLDSAYGSSPAVLRILVRVGEAMGEKGLVTQEGQPDVIVPTKDLLYPKGANRTEAEITGTA